ncbi:MAG: M23 family metallopeptidase [Deltaproteobacteria bacterium]|jgi:hypothetical protein|nr:M23 family metallopeptidase [Deltaproteobacteria bacterium]
MSGFLSPKFLFLLLLAFFLVCVGQVKTLQAEEPDLFTPNNPGAAGDLTPVVKIFPNSIDIGGTGRVLLNGLTLEDNPRGSFDGRPIFFFETKKGLIGIFGVDIMLKPGNYPLTLTYEREGSAQKMVTQVGVKTKDYGTRSITVPENQVSLSPEDQKRAAEEKVLTDAALATVSPIRLWRGEFLSPVDAGVSSSFGRKTRINGVLNPRPHAGTDFRANVGEPVRAPANGRVILVGDHFFAGKSIYIDHGQGLISMYFHLSDISVTNGQEIFKGDTPIGKVGKSGRVSGAHLHYGVYLNGARIDPIAFKKMTQDIEEN